MIGPITNGEALFFLFPSLWWRFIRTHTTHPSHNTRRVSCHPSGTRGQTIPKGSFLLSHRSIEGSLRPLGLFWIRGKSNGKQILGFVRTWLNKMGFSLDVDPSLYATPPHSPLLEYASGRDLDPSLEGLVVSPAMVYQTISPSQLADFSSPDSASPSSPPFLYPASPLTPSPSASGSDDYPSPPSPAANRVTNRNRTKAKLMVTKPHRHDEEEEGSHAKRHQTKLACSWCRKLSKKCDTQRPCSRCVKFDRCDECVDAPPRRPRVKGVERGTYQKTRKLATVDYPEAVKRRESYVSKLEKRGKSVKVGLTAEELLEKTRQDEARMDKEIQKAMEFMPPVMEDVNVFKAVESLPAEQVGLVPFTGPLEDLFTCTASPEVKELPASSLQPSPVDSLFESLSPESDSSSTDYDHDLEQTLQWHALEYYPNIMAIVEAALASKAGESASSETTSLVDMEEFLSWGDGSSMEVS
jgi:hypothetical protein